MKLKEHLKKSISYVLNLIYPPRCAFCRKLLYKTENGICKACTEALPLVPYEAMREDIDSIKLCVAPLYYKDTVRQSLLRYKFQALTGYAEIYADFITKAIDEASINCDIITWVPLSRKRFRERGYDQSKLIAMEVAKRIDVPSIKLLDKFVDNKRQSSISGAEERRKNSTGVYRICKSIDIFGKTVLLIDDIVTTGATLSECAKILKNAGCTEVYAAAVAMREHILGESK